MLVVILWNFPVMCSILLGNDCKEGTQPEQYHSNLWVVMHAYRRVNIAQLDVQFQLN